ncbi:MAG: manganese efflux pump MntP family protein [Pseudomonadota bacterium]
MEFITIIIISIALALDCFAVSICSSIYYSKINRKTILKIAFSFAFFQAFMPVLGWLLGISFKIYISSIDHWIAFFLLFAVGAKMIYQSRKVKNECRPLISNTMILALSIATSIDAFVIGITFSILDINIILPVLMIGLITFFLSITGLNLGKQIKRICNETIIETFGGLILIAIGLKILIEHTI